MLTAFTLDFEHVRDVGVVVGFNILDWLVLFWLFDAASVDCVSEYDAIESGKVDVFVLRVVG